MAPVSPVTKTARQAQITGILSYAAVHSQDELAELLAQRGVRVTQATLSRDLDELGAVRLRGSDGALVYALPGEPGGPGSRPGGLGAEPARTPLAAGVARPAGPASSAGLFRSAGPVRPAAAGWPATAGGPAGTARLAPEHAPPASPATEHSARLARVAAEFLFSAEASANLVVLRTPAGAAQFLAAAIDHAAWPSILGTVAGDDTVLVITRQPTGGAEVARSLLRIAERRT